MRLSEVSSLWLPSGFERVVDKELRELDRQLFLDREFDGRRFFFTVRYGSPGNDREPDLILDWREADGTPKELNHALLYEVKRMISEGPPRVKEIARRNAELRRSRDAAHHEQYLDIALDMQPRVRGVRSIVMPRTRNVGMAARRQRIRDMERMAGLR